MYSPLAVLQAAAGSPGFSQAQLDSLFLLKSFFYSCLPSCFFFPRCAGS